MIQDIAPSKLDNAFSHCTPRPNDFILLFDDDGRLLTNVEGGYVRFTTGADVSADVSASDVVYLFSIDDARYFLAFENAKAPAKGFEYRGVRELRDCSQGSGLFAAFTAYHLWKWYRDNRYCGACGGPTGFHEMERALECKRCGHVIFPRINPAVIVGVIDGDNLLITRYRTGYAHNALVAGFTEIGETLEQTVEREVMEEVGIRVKNIRYYKSQPWGMAQDLLAGFFCEVEGDNAIRMDENELKYAQWVKREDIVLQPGRISLTNEMMDMFKKGLVR